MFSQYVALINVLSNMNYKGLSEILISTTKPSEVQNLPASLE